MTALATFENLPPASENVRRLASRQFGGSFVPRVDVKPFLMLMVSGDR